VDLRFNATLPGTGGEEGAGGSLEFVPGSATTFDSGNRSVRFQVQNSGDSPIGLSSLTAVYTSSPTAYYEEVDWNYLWTLWSSTTPRNGSGDTATFSEQGVTAGSSVTLELEDFRNSPVGGGGNVNMRGVDFEITFSDGSVITFTTP
jgi:hypothetical protein